MLQPRLPSICNVFFISKGNIVYFYFEKKTCVLNVTQTILRANTYWIVNLFYGSF